MEKSIASSTTPKANKFARAFRWFFNLSMLGRGLVGIAVAVTLIALFYAEENWRGKHDWETYKRELKAGGVELDWQKFVPPAVPDDQNFAMTPFLAPLFDFNPRPLEPGQSAWRDTDGFGRITNFATAFELPNDYDKGQPIHQGQPEWRMTDFAHWLGVLWEQRHASTPEPAHATKAKAAAALLKDLEDYKPMLDELRTARQRPFSRFNIEYGAEDPASILLPHLGLLKRINQLVRVRAAAELAVGNTEAAFDDVGFMFFLADSIHNEPVLISQVVRMVMLDATEQIIWEGLADHRWSDAQLRDFQARLQKITFLKDVGSSVRTERAAFGSVEFDFIRNHPYVLRDLLDQSDNTFPIYFLLVAPGGWLYQEQISFQRAYDERWLVALDPQTGQIHPKKVDEADQLLKKDADGSFSRLWHHQIFSKLLFPPMSKLYRRSAVAQSAADQAVVVCALERHRLANGKFPETLESLMPQFMDKLPLDVCSGQPLKYKRLESGQFLLYSVGWNEKDDGGTTVMDQTGTSPDLTQGDWVWPGYQNK